MAVRRYARDRHGRFASGGGNGTIANRSKSAAPAKPGGSMTKALRRGQRKLYRAEQDRMHMLGGNVAGMRIIQRNVRKGAAPKATGGTSGGSRAGSVSGALRGTMRQLAQSDARYYRNMGAALGGSKTQGTLGGSKPRRRLKGS